MGKWCRRSTGDRKLKQAIDMMINRYKYFRWTPRTAWISFVYMTVIPSALLYAGWRVEVRDFSFLYLAIRGSAWVFAGEMSCWSVVERSADETIPVE